MNNDMKPIGRKMSILMGTTLSFCLSLTGNLSSGRFTVPGFLISFVISLIISLVIGFLVPMKQVTEILSEKIGLKRNAPAARFFDALVSDIIYTPLITFVMVTMAYKNAVSHGAQLRYLPMLGSSMVLSMAVGYVLIFIFMPLYMKLLLKERK